MFYHKKNEKQPAISSSLLLASDGNRRLKFGVVWPPRRNSMGRGQLAPQEGVAIATTSWGTDDASALQRPRLQSWCFVSSRPATSSYPFIFTSSRFCDWLAWPSKDFSRYNESISIIYQRDASKPTLPPGLIRSRRELIANPRRSVYREKKRESFFPFYSFGEL